jgi:type III restriction enzyme
MKSAIDQPIINSPYKKPEKYWSYDRESKFFDLKEGRRPAGYVVASEKSKAFDDPGIFVEIPLVNLIRPRVDAWRDKGYPGVTGITKRLLEHWRNPEEREYRQFFFCQMEAIETMIWFLEAPDAEKVGIKIQRPVRRLAWRSPIRQRGCGEHACQVRTVNGATQGNHRDGPEPCPRLSQGSNGP